MIEHNALLNKRIISNSKVPYLNQVIQISFYEESKAFKIYELINEKFKQDIFNSIIKERENHIDTIKSLAEKYEIEILTADCTNNYKSLRDALEILISLELDLISSYDKILIDLQEEDVKDKFYIFQANAYNEFLPKLRSSINKSEHHDIYNAIQNLIKGDFDINSLSDIIKGSKQNLIFGAILGAGASFILNNTKLKETIKSFLDQNKKEEK